MFSWEFEAADFINNTGYRISDPGPMHVPVHAFSVHRDDELRLILKTEAPVNATSSTTPQASGTARITTEQVKLQNGAGSEALLEGVLPFHLSKSHAPEPGHLREEARVHVLTVAINEQAEAAYTIEWLENLPREPFTWPDSIRTTTETTATRAISLIDGGITVSTSNSHIDMSQSAAKLTVAGQTLYVCALHGKRTDGTKRGCIIYVGKPTDFIRKKIRCALSFALGFYLVELGHTVYDKDWDIVTATSRSAYSLAKRTFDASPMPLAHLSGRNFQRDLGRAEFTRMVEALVVNYELLDLGNLSWAYWHAGTATVHISPAHFGAAIEALQDAYCKGHPDVGRTKILPTAQWKSLRDTIKEVIDGALIDEESKAALKEKLNDINKPPQRVILKSLLDAIGLELSSAENEAWKRRNDAAHGTPIPEGQELAAIRDMKLLRGLFNRMLLRMSNAADGYIDYTSLGLPIRRLHEGAPSN